ncbi:STAS domain-containing protein [Spirillospora sp. NPDC047279]|uniref:STAS domain-containing protein n=1 Tax=Spirillospora sp. NPDC047279 TaxID=3155478 RepID=UPI0033E1DE55
MRDTVVDMVVVEGLRHTTVLLTGEMDRMSSPTVQLRLRRLATTTGRPLVLNLSGVSFFDAEGLRAVSATARRCEERGIGLAAVGVRPFAAKMFHILRLHERIPLCATETEALWCLLPPTDAELAAWLDGETP